MNLKTHDVNRGMTLKDATFIDKMRAKHIPQTAAMPGQYEQCQGCLQEWPCETSILLDILWNKTIPA